MTDDGTTPHSREVGILLRNIREAADLLAKDVALGIKWSPVKISRAEHGKLMLSDVDVTASAIFCGAVGDELEELLDLVREEDAGYRFKPHRAELPDGVRSLIIEESSAANIIEYEPVFIPGLAQTEDYVRTLISSNRTVPKEEIVPRVRARMGRQGLIKRHDPPQCRFLISENALRMMIGSPQIMVEQLLHLLFLDSRPQCDIRVVPKEASSPGVTNHSFRIMTYVEHRPVIYVPTLTASVFLDKPADLDAYRDKLAGIDNAALDGRQSRERLERIASEFEVMGDAEDDHA
jgi:hypothetical protein